LCDLLPCGKRGLFTSFTNRNADAHSVLSNSLCLLCGAVDGLDTTALEEVLARNGEDFADCIPNTLSMQSFRFDTLLRTNWEKYASIILNEIDRTCLYKPRKGATAFWETTKGEAVFWEAGSLCYCWSALPIYYYQTLLK
jgi:hypothetical protein